MLEDRRNSLKGQKRDLLKDYDKGAFGRKGQILVTEKGMIGRGDQDNKVGGAVCALCGKKPFILLLTKDDGSGVYREYVRHTYVREIIKGIIRRAYKAYLGNLALI